MTTHGWLVAGLLGGSLIGTRIAASWYVRFALRRGIIAKINARTLHERTVPRGGGITFGMIFSMASVVAWAAGAMSTHLMLVLGLGGAAAATIGFVDDVHELPALRKLGLHAALGAWLVAVTYAPVLGPLAEKAGPLATMLIVLVPWGLVLWLINMYNFVDGVDGMAIIGAVFVSATAALVLWLTDGSRDLMFAFAQLGAASLGFLFLNLPPARVFMGDAGSIFLGYCFAGLLVVTVATGEISVWTWIAMLSYFIADTSTTGLYRLLLVRDWYGVHRSHAYQNLARITGSHAKVTYGVALYHLLWALPFALWSVLDPGWAPVAAVLSVAPAVAWTLRFGPPLSRD